MRWHESQIAWVGCLLAACGGRAFSGENGDASQGNGGAGGMVATTGDGSGGGGARGGSAGAGATGGAQGIDGGPGIGGSAGAGGSDSAACPGPGVDLASSDENCGACGYACLKGRHCNRGRCTPAWLPLSTNGVPPSRTRHAAGSVSGKYVVLGGSSSSLGLAMNSVAAYDLATDTWSTLAPLNAARCSHGAASTGTSILTFGGLSDCSNGTTEGPGLEIFMPTGAAGVWQTVVAIGAPEVRYIFASTWTGNAFFVYGGSTNLAPAILSGALFSPTGVNWSDASCSLAGCERGGYFSAFTDGPLIRVWGGGPYGNAPAGLVYSTTNLSWSGWAVPSGTSGHLAQRFADDGRRLYYLTAANLLSIYDRKTSSWLSNDTSPMPAGFCTEGAAAWTGAELVAWSGSCGVAPISVGGRYQPPAPP